MQKILFIWHQHFQSVVETFKQLHVVISQKERHLKCQATSPTCISVPFSSHSLALLPPAPAHLQFLWDPFAPKHTAARPDNRWDMWSLRTFSPNPTGFPKTHGEWISYCIWGWSKWSARENPKGIDELMSVGPSYLCPAFFKRDVKIEIWGSNLR